MQPRLFIPLQILSPRWTNTIIDALDRAAYKESFSCENLFFFFSKLCGKNLFVNSFCITNGRII